MYVANNILNFLSKIMLCKEHFTFSLFSIHTSIQTSITIDSLGVHYHFSHHILKRKMNNLEHVYSGFPRRIVAHPLGWFTLEKMRQRQDLITFVRCAVSGDSTEPCPAQNP